jgi:hypothetical protein
MAWDLAELLRLRPGARREFSYVLVVGDRAPGEVLDVKAMDDELLARAVAEELRADGRQVTAIMLERIVTRSDVQICTHRLDS